MDKLDMQTPDGVEMNIDKIAALFPGCITEDRDESGNVKRAVDFDLLRQELSGDVVEGVRERYTLNWPGKNEAIATANAPINKTLRPCREESVDFDSTENLYIEGDNLEALKLLQETYLGKVKMIYIDPPYNTGKDFIYSDNFTADQEEYDLLSEQKTEEGGRLVANPDSNGRYHSDWLTMLYPRLKLARNLLADDGVVFISIDDNEHHNLRKLCDEVFGEMNFIANAVWQKAYVANMTAKHISNTHDHVLVYAKTAASLQLGRFERSQEQLDKFKNPDNDPRGAWKAENLSAGKFYAAGQFEIITPAGRSVSPPSGRYWRCNQETYKNWEGEGRIWYGKEGTGRPMLKKYLSEVEAGLTPETWWKHQDFGSNKSASTALKKLFDGKLLFDTPKPVDLVQRVVALANDKNAICVDFFSGSAVTAHAVIQQNAEDGGNRKFIMMQIAEECDEKSVAFKEGFETIAEIGKERIRRAGQKIREENATTAADLDIGFRVLKVDDSNMNDVYYTPDQLDQGDIDLFAEHIKEDRTAEDLLFQVMLDWGVPLSAKIEKQTVDGKSIYLVNENDLLASFDKGITEDLVKKLAEHRPMRAVFRDDAFESDSLKINVDQIFKVLSPGTEVKSI